VRKIVNEDLAENIWHSQHMDKIIPSLLYNIQIEDYKVGFHASYFSLHFKNFLFEKKTPAFLDILKGPNGQIRLAREWYNWKAYG
jgi:hypothetical protein